MALNLHSSQQMGALKVPTFLKKTYQLLNSHQDVVRWGPNGVGFVILNEALFEKEILPKYFKHSNYSSFVRQLNMYNFRKIRQNNGGSYFTHQCFSKGNESKLSLIQRRPEKKRKNTISEPSIQIIRELENKEVEGSQQTPPQAQEINNVNLQALNQIKVKEEGYLKQITTNEQTQANKFSIQILPKQTARNTIFTIAIMPVRPTFCFFY